MIDGIFELFDSSPFQLRRTSLVCKLTTQAHMARVVGLQTDSVVVTETRLN